MFCTMHALRIHDTYMYVYFDKLKVLYTTKSKLVFLWSIRASKLIKETLTSRKYLLDISLLCDSFVFVTNCNNVNFLKILKLTQAVYRMILK